MFDSFYEFYQRDLTKLEEEVLAFPDDDALWKIIGQVSNSGGNLALHLCGNLNHFIGAVLGNTGYVRERDKEFNTKGLSRQEVASEIRTCRETVLQILGSLKGTDVNIPYPVKVFDRDMTIGHFIMHLLGHLSYHLGQINYLRRVLG
ncbi:MAG: DinB family protein [Flavobacteriales bacterium]|nr:DinB family protein [Flavobacteriales bacterium]MCB9449114.1 DinB family protein [Flavobacteriales bacterium]